MMLKIKKFEKEDLNMIETNFHFPESSKAAMMKETCLSAYTALLESKVFMIGGVYGLWQNVGEAWFIASNKIHESARPFIRFAKTDVMQKVVDENGLWRVQAVCKEDWPAALKFARFMGFEPEGVMRKYGPEGMDYIRVAWVR